MNSMEAVFPDDFSVAGSLKNFKDYLDYLAAIGPKYGYLPKPTKSFLIVKEKNWWKSKTYLLIQERTSAVIGSYRDEYVKYFVKDWDNQLTILSIIEETQPQTAYLAFRF